MVRSASCWLHFIWNKTKQYNRTKPPNQPNKNKNKTNPTKQKPQTSKKTHTKSWEAFCWWWQWWEKFWLCLQAIEYGNIPTNPHQHTKNTNWFYYFFLTNESSGIHDSGSSDVPWYDNLYLTGEKLKKKSQQTNLPLTDFSCLMRSLIHQPSSQRAAMLETLRVSTPTEAQSPYLCTNNGSQMLHYGTSSWKPYTPSTANATRSASHLKGGSKHLAISQWAPECEAFVLLVC